MPANSPIKPIDRRVFLGQSAATAVSTITASSLLSNSLVSYSAAAPEVLRAVNQKQVLNVACVGVKGMGWADLSSVGSHPKVKFVGFCDIDRSRFDQADQAFPNVAHFIDYREMLSTLGDKVDAVIVSTPDHMHAPAAMMAMQQGKHIYCQKPLSHTVWESRQMQLLASKKNLATQMGNQIHSAAEYRLGVRLIQGGAIGKVSEVHSWVGVQGRQYSNRTDRPESGTVPDSVAWDLWLGAAPLRPFAADVYHPFKWRDWQDFGSGALGDFGCHLLDPVFGALALTAPTSVIAEHAGINEEVWPGPETVTYTFPSTRYTSGNSIQVVWRDGGLKPAHELAQLPDGVELPVNGSIFIGEGGVMLLPHVGMPRLYEKNRVKQYVMPEVTGTNHWHDWVDAVVDGTKTSDGFDFAGPVSETVQLGNVAARFPGKKMDWNSKEMTCSNMQEANRFLTKSYRKGFEVHAG
jgi:predicted dehydrogenase